MDKQCQALTLKGTQCSRKAIDGKYCTQHARMYLGINTLITEEMLKVDKTLESKAVENKAVGSKAITNVATNNINNNVNETKIDIRNNPKYQELLKVRIKLGDEIRVFDAYRNTINPLDKDAFDKIFRKGQRILYLIADKWKTINNLIKKQSSENSDELINETITLYNNASFLINSVISELMGKPRVFPKIEAPKAELINNNIFNEFWDNFVPSISFESKAVESCKKESSLIVDIYSECKIEKVESVRNIADIKKYFYDNLRLTHFICEIHNYLSIDLVNRVHQWITSLDIVSVKDALYIFDANLTGLKSVFAIKVVKDSVDKDINCNIMHELCTGLACTNKYREVIPNFAFIFGGFTCREPYVSQNNIRYCENLTYPVAYVLYEFIEGDIWSKAMKSWTPIMLVTNLISIVYALDYANKKDQFTHYDLHTDNIIIRNPFKRNIATPIIINGQKIYIVNAGIPTIIDYGLSHFKYQDQSYGFYETEFAGVFPDLSFPLFDIYKLLLFTSKISKNFNLPILETCRALLMFFTNDGLEDVIRVQLNYSDDRYGNLPPLPWLTKLSCADFGVFLQEKFDFRGIIYTEDELPETIPILGMDKNQLFVG